MTNPQQPLGRRSIAAATIVPLLAGLVTSCAATKDVRSKTIKNPVIMTESGRLLLRHVNTAVITASPPAQQFRLVEFFWSQSCGDTMRAFRQIKAKIRNPPPGTVIVLSLVARSRFDVNPCSSIRSVDQASYGQAVLAVLEAGAAKGGPLTDAQVNQAIWSFPRGGGGYRSDFAENCIRQSQQQSLAAGVVETPFFFINGRKAALSEFTA